eukprot:3706734-Pleurochrysis_carterae.AAC.9
MKAVRPQGSELLWRQLGGIHRSRPQNNSHTPLGWINIGGGGKYRPPRIMNYNSTAEGSSA